MPGVLGGVATPRLFLELHPPPFELRGQLAEPPLGALEARRQAARGLEGQRVEGGLVPPEEAKQADDGGLGPRQPRVVGYGGGDVGLGPSEGHAHVLEVRRRRVDFARRARSRRGFRHRRADFPRELDGQILFARHVVPAIILKRRGRGPGRGTVNAVESRRSAPPGG